MRELIEIAESRALPPDRGGAALGQSVFGKPGGCEKARRCENGQANRSCQDYPVRKWIRRVQSPRDPRAANATAANSALVTMRAPPPKIVGSGNCFDTLLFIPTIGRLTKVSRRRNLPRSGQQRTSW